MLLPIILRARYTYCVKLSILYDCFNLPTYRIGGTSRVFQFFTIASTEVFRAYLDRDNVSFNSLRLLHPLVLVVVAVLVETFNSLRLLHVYTIDKQIQRYISFQFFTIASTTCFSSSSELYSCFFQFFTIASLAGLKDMAVKTEDAFNSLRLLQVQAIVIAYRDRLTLSILYDCFTR